MSEASLKSRESDRRHPRESGGASSPQEMDSRLGGNDQIPQSGEAKTGGNTRGKEARPQTLPLLLEVGCEEIPARFLEAAARQLGERLRDSLLSNRLLVGPDGHLILAPAEAHLAPLLTFFTPRRLAAYLPQILASQADRVRHMEGPPVRVAVSQDGKYTRAAEAFVTREHAKLEDLRIKKTPKGDYLELVKTDHGSPASEVLPNILPAVIWNMNFPKSMYWGKPSAGAFRFVRPIRWVLAILGEGKQAEAVSFEIPGVHSGDFTLGHRVYSKRPITVRSFKDYGAKLRRACVEFDPENRRRTLRAKTKALLEDSTLLIEDADLEEWLVNSTEWPSAIRGGFDPRFLHLPREILITVMRDHQKYFAVENPQGILEPYFLAALNVDSDERGLIRQGHERVLRARFSDAEFFWNADQRTRLRDRLPLLDKVTYQAELGSYGDKVRRMRALAEKTCRELTGQHALSSREGDAVLRAVELCKCDLTTQMVHEFPELQGIVGGLYARKQEERLDVADAVYDHYLPKSLDDRCPRSLVGAVVSLVDKLDSVAGGFAAGLKPSGSSDPFGLRRNGNGIIKVLLEVMPTMLFSELAVAARDAFPEKKAVFTEFIDFLIERLQHYLGQRFRYDTVRAVLADPDHALEAFNMPAEALHRVRVLEQFRDTEDFVALAQAAKRVRNILAKSATEVAQGRTSVDESLMEPGPETELWNKYHEGCATLGAGGPFWTGGSYDYEMVFAYLSTFRPFVDEFFNKVLVMADDPALRRNRLLMLSLLDQRIFSKFVRLSEIVPGTPNVDAPTSRPNKAEG